MFLRVPYQNTTSRAFTGAGSTSITPFPMSSIVRLSVKTTCNVYQRAGDDAQLGLLMYPPRLGLTISATRQWESSFLAAVDS